MSASQLWRLAVTVPASAVATFAEVVGAQAESVATFEVEEGDRWLVEAVLRAEVDRPRLIARVAVLAEALGLAVPDLVVQPLPAMDWLSRSYESFPPQRVGRYYIHGSHVGGRVPAACIGLRVDAATAFGSGEHATTRGCLLALDRLARRQRVGRALDMGCGSGILAMAMAKTWRRPVVAVDIDPEAVRVTHGNARANGVAHLVRVAGGNGYKTPLARRGRPYDVVAANILARPLARMAPDLRRALRRGGVAVLSGLLVRQERHVLAAHRAQRLRLVRRLHLDGWSTLVLAR